MSSPFFSIVVPTYNRAHLIGKTIEGLLGQDFSDFEVIVVDDGSKDNTKEVVAKINDARITYYLKENGERGAARNFGRLKARGQYINFFDSDDLVYPNHLTEAKKMVDEKKQPEIFHLGYDFKTPDGTVTKRIDNLTREVIDRVLFDNVLSCNGVFVRRDIANEYPFEEDRAMASSEDWELWIRLISRFPLQYSNAVTTSVVGHDERSIFTISADKVIARDLLMIHKLRQDDEVSKNYGKRFKKFTAQRYSFFMLCLSEQGRNQEVLKWAWKAWQCYPPIFFTKRYLVSIKKVFFK
jgi:glycosyltransferase involved in cell wall biosynthesis